MRTKRSGYPTIALETLTEAWRLRPEDLKCIEECRSNTHRLRSALQLCALRHQGRFLDKPAEVSPQVLAHLAGQLGFSTVPSLDKALWAPTESHQRERIREHLGFLPWSQVQEEALRLHLETCLRGDYRSNDVLGIAGGFLLGRKVVRPARSTMSRLVASVVRSVQEGMSGEIVEKLSQGQIHALEAMIQVKSEQSVSPLQELKAFPPEAGPEVLWEHLARWEALEKQGISRIDLTGISPGLVEAMAGTVRGNDVHTLRRVEPRTKRTGLLACFMFEACKNLLDHIVNLNNQWLTGHQRRAMHHAESRAAEARGQKWKALNAAGQSLKKLLEASEGASIGSFVQEQGRERLTKIVQDCEALEQTGTVQDLAELARGYSVLRRYAPAFYRLPFKATEGGEEYLIAINLLRGLDEKGISVLPEDAPVGFLTGGWSRQVRDKEQRLIRARWEMAFMMRLSEALRSGLVYLSESRAYRSPADRMLPDSKWKEVRAEAAAALGLPETWEEVLAELRAGFSQGAKGAAAALAQGDFIRMMPNGKLKMRREKAIPEPPTTSVLRQLISDRMRPIRIEDVLEEAEEATGFMNAFKPPEKLQDRQAIPHEGLMASLIAEGTNLGLLGMSRCTEGLTYDFLRRVSENHLRPETLRAGCQYLVNAHNRMAITRIWGGGTLSSSDSQRFVIRRSSSMGAVYPRFAGFDNRMLGIYTHTSDTDDVLATQLVSCAEREAPYVIDGLFQNTSEVKPTAHTTDTHGYTEKLFGLCYLLGIDFCPRIKNMAKAQIYRMGKEKVPVEIEGLFSGSVNPVTMGKQWEEFLRLALSIKRGFGTAQSLMQSLSGMMESTPLAKALTAFGQLVKTIYILRYFGDPKLRRDVQRQLNKGEERHQLARHIRFAHRGDFRTNNLAAILNQATCLSLLSNAVLLSNTRQIERIVGELEAEGHIVDPADLAHISPISFKNVIPHGTYWFFKRSVEVA